MTNQLHRDALYNSANTRRCVAEAIAVSGLAAGGIAVWLYLRDDHRGRGATIDTTVHRTDGDWSRRLGAVLRLRGPA